MSSTGFGIYVHIPFCLQKCHYCDFVTVTVEEPPSSGGDYVKSLLAELHRRSSTVREFTPHTLNSIYFGGGTPSLLPASDILAVRNEIATLGYRLTPNCEITIEINPGTIDTEKLDRYLDAGVNRFSVGAQTFRDDYLQACGRKHTANDTRDTLRLLARRKVNYSLDLLFGLPQQRLADLHQDLTELAAFSPPHVSLYNLTVPQAHFMNVGRAPDDEQAAMFEEIEAALKKMDISRYEISNFAKPGFESRHNQLYWQGAPYWGIGVGAHSYFPKAGDFGVRVSNPASMSLWRAQISQQNDQAPYWAELPAAQAERLKLHEALTDFFHIRLRQTKGFTWDELEQTLAFFALNSDRISGLLASTRKRIDHLVSRELVHEKEGRVRLTAKGYPLANVVFLELTFSARDA